jgi:tetratricopeptide (TPR) repeat protein
LQRVVALFEQKDNLYTDINTPAVMKNINVLLLRIVLFLQVLQGNAQPLKTPALLDSLDDLLSYLRENTSEATFPEPLKIAAALCNQDATVDSLVSRLIQSEDVLIGMFRDSGIINRYPFKQEKLLAFGQATMKLSALVLPGKENLLYAAALHNMGIFVMLSDALKAREFFEEALAIRKKISGKEDVDYVKTLVNLALVYEVEGKRDTAYKMILQSLAITAKTRGIENSLYADELFCLANFYNQIKTSDTATLLYEQELSLRRKMLGDSNARLALYLCRTAIIYFYTGQYKKAFALYREAAAITQQTLGEENFQYAWCLSGVGSAYYRLAEYEKAIPYFDRSLEIEKKLCTEGYCTLDIPVNLHNLATTYQCLGKYEKALPLFQEAVSIEKANQKNNNGFPFDMPYLAILYGMTGKYKEAFDLINQTTATMKQSKKEYGIDYIRTLNFLGVSYTTIKEYSQAITVLKRALQHAEEIYGTLNVEYATTLNNMAIAYKGCLCMIQQWH